MAQTAEATATAAATRLGNQRFRTDKTRVANTPPERVSELAREVLEAAHATIRKHQVTYAEYDALKAWLIQIGEDGEWPFFLDVFVEHVIEEVANAAREGSRGTIEGPFYAPGAPLSHREVTLPMRKGEAGTPLQFRGQVRSVAGTAPLNATVDIWHCDDEGFYSQFAPGLPEWNLRGRVTTDENGNFVINTIQPAPYQIPTDGATGAIIRAANWHAWRPAHPHLKVSAPDHLLITTQLYFPGDPHNDDDIATAVKPELMLDPKAGCDGTGLDVVHDFVVETGLI